MRTREERVVKGLPWGFVGEGGGGGFPSGGVSVDAKGDRE